MDELLIEVASGVAVGLGMGLVGAGGAIFTVPVFGTLLGHDAKLAIAEALAVTGCVAAVSGAVAGARRMVDWPRVASFGAAGIVGAQAAAPVAVRMAASVQVAMFAAVAGYAAWRMWASAGGVGDGAKTGGAGAESDARGSVALGEGGGKDRRAWWKPYAVGFAIGMLTSVLGVGGGFLLIPALAVLEGLPMTRAVATSLVVIAINAAAGLAGLWINGGFDADAFHGRPVAIVAGCGVAGSVLGAAIQRRVPQGMLRRVFAVLLVAVAVAMVLK